MADAYIGEAELFCEDCAADWMDGPYADGGGEDDVPQHCAHCHVPLNNPLTSDGVRYVIERLKEDLAVGIDGTIYPQYDGTWYEGSPHYAILKDWAEQLRNYGLSAEDRAIVNQYLEAIGE